MTRALELAKFGRESPPSGVVVGTTDSQTLSSKTFSDGPVFSSHEINAVPYLNASRVLSSSSTFVFDGTNMGLGIATPAATLHVNASGGGTIRASRSSVGGDYIQLDHDGTDGTLRVSGNNKLYLTTNSTARITIDGSGNVGFGLAPVNNSYNIQSYGGVRAGTSVVAQGTLNSYTGAGAFLSYEAYGGRLEAYDYANSAYKNFAITPNGGSVGIGLINASDYGKLAVTGTIAQWNSVASGAELARIQWYNTATNYDVASIRTFIGAGQVNRGELGFYVNNGASQQLALYIDRNQNIGIGMASPSYKLEVVSTGNDVLKLSGGASATLMQFNAASTDDYVFGTVTSLAGIGIKNITDDRYDFFINDSGNVGIGTNSPSYALHVKRTSGNSGIYTDYNGTNIGRIEAASNGNLYIGLTTGSGDISIGNTANANAIFLNNSGNVGIGTTSPIAKFRVQGQNASVFTGGGGIALGANAVFVGDGTTSGMATYSRVAIVPNIEYGTSELYFSTRGLSSYSEYGAGIRNIWGGSDARNNILAFFTSSAAEQNVERVRIGSDGVTTFYNNIRFPNNNTGIHWAASASEDFYMDCIPGQRTVRLRNWNTSDPNIQVTGMQAGVFKPAIGIEFPATQVNDANPNILDDYEEGTWTPTWIGSTTNPTVTYDTQAGNYTKIGRMVYFDIRLVTTGSTGGTGNLEIGNLPFATLTTTGNPGFGHVSFSYGWAGNAVLSTGVGNAVARLITYTQYAGNPGNTQVPANALAGATVYFTCSGWYIAA